AAIEAAHKVLDADPMGYWESPRLRERISEQYRADYGLDIDPARIVLTCGASPALVVALSLGFKPGARIATARPGYVAYRNTMRALHRDAVEIAGGSNVRSQMPPYARETLDPAPGAVILASPANPTGTLIPRTDLAAIAHICRERKIRIISDEIYHG